MKWVLFAIAWVIILFAGVFVDVYFDMQRPYMYAVLRDGLAGILGVLIWTHIK